MRRATTAARALAGLAGAAVSIRRGGPALGPALARACAREETYGRPVLWLAPGMALGAALHLGLAADPPAILLYPVAALAILPCLALGRLARAAPIALILAAIACGAVAADLSVRRAAGPRIEAIVASAEVTGRILRIEPRAERAPRALLLVHTIQGRDGPPPRRILVYGRGLEGVAVGAGVTFRARLVPMPPPAHPGAYEPAFAAYFDGIGGQAFLYGRTRAAEVPPLGTVLAAWTAVEAWRTALTQDIVARLGPHTGPVAAALVTGQRTAVTEELRADFNASGLMHVLSISGLHMALVAGGVFWLFRALLAAIPFVALRLPVKKLAAVLALATATFYEIVSGAEVATTRSYIMIAIVFLAILIDRPGITMRNLMTAALIILAVQPESVFSASFRMSFGATAALVAAYERGLMPRLSHHDQPLALRIPARAAEIVLATAFVSILCELAILPVQLFHFHRVVWFGLVGNVLALAVVDTLIMPAALVTLALGSFGLADWPIAVLGFGVNRMIDIARFVGSFPGAVTNVAGFGPLALVLALAGVVWACLWRTPIALAGVALYLAGFAVWAIEGRPDIHVAATGGQVAVRGPDGRLAVDTTERDDFVLGRWLERDGDRRRPADATLTAARRCDAAGCTLPLGTGGVVAMPRSLHALVEDCARADIVVTRFSVPIACPRARLVVDRRVLDRAYGLSVSWNGGAPRVTTHAERCGTRPWCPGSSSEPARAPFRRRAAAPQ